MSVPSEVSVGILVGGGGRDRDIAPCLHSREHDTGSGPEHATSLNIGASTFDQFPRPTGKLLPPTPLSTLRPEALDNIYRVAI